MPWIHKFIVSLVHESVGPRVREFASLWIYSSVFLLLSLIDRMERLKHTVFWNEMEIISADDDCSVHFGRNDTAGEDTTSDRNFTSEGAFLVCQSPAIQYKFNRSGSRVDCLVIWSIGAKR